MNSPKKGLSLLLIDSDTAAAQRILAALARHMDPAQAHWARSGSEALEWLLKGALPSLILLDTELEDMDGLTVLRQIKRKVWIRRIPTVLLSSSVSIAKVQEGYAAGASSFISKDVEPEQLAGLAEILCSYWFDTCRVPAP